MNLEKILTNKKYKYCEFIIYDNELEEEQCIYRNNFPVTKEKGKTYFIGLLTKTERDYYLQFLIDYGKREVIYLDVIKDEQKIIIDI